jgi:hypothetical protein
MSSLVETVVEMLRSVSSAGENEDAENILSDFQIDPFDLADIEGGWKWVAMTTVKSLSGFSPSAFKESGPNVYRSNDCVIIRFSHPVMSRMTWMIFESETTGLHVM